MRKSLLLLVFCCCLTASLAASAQYVQQRPLPSAGVRGTLGEPLAFPEVKIGSRVLRITPGARIYDQSNRTIVHAQLSPGAEVLYTSEPTGDIQRIYVLTEQELLRLRQAGRR